MWSETRDTSFKLTAQIRDHLATRFDADALELILQWQTPDGRAWFLAPFLPPLAPITDAAPADPNAPVTMPDIRVLVRVDDPVIQDLLEKVWQPYWDRYSDEDLARSDEALPGLEMARQRRAAKTAKP